MTLEALASIVVTGLVVGAFARLAVPGPDPMPWWATMLFGLAGAFLGGGVGFQLAGVLGAFLGSVVAATILILVYRRLVQGRPITGPGAKLRR